MVYKNVDVSSGMVNGVIGKYVTSSDNVLVLKTADNELLPLPKMRQKILLNFDSIQLYRIQFPVVDATAQTIHKAQGMTLDRCHVSIDQNIFCEGQAYVALSRVRKSTDLHLRHFDKNVVRVDQRVIKLLTHIRKYNSMKNIKFTNCTKGNQTTNSSNPILIPKKTNKITDDSHNLDYKEIIKLFTKSKDLSLKNFETDDYQLSYQTKQKAIFKFFSSNEGLVSSIFVNLKEMNKQIFECDLTVDENVALRLHPVFRREYSAIKTSADGNCLFNMISICLFGHNEYSTFFRFLTITVLIKYKDYYSDILK
ncbi:unnamed protein product [Brachionus calyciflorus]|uniref:OTU domain-containing protein n=1 Tax=Brachionus calyciflorus TaxID=104777 RepID=A0A814RN09_9BILA|nr:unnamed protein product [Brachionus calyciflorus]